MGDLTSYLEAVSRQENFPAASGEVIEHWRVERGSFDDVSIILSFMENHPHLDYGSPGPLVHYVETYFRHGYEDELIKSVSRKPSTHTVWMLNRVINGVKEARNRAGLIDVLSRVADNAKADEYTKDQATHFLDRLKGLEE